MKKAATKSSVNPSERISQQIAELDDWRGPMMARLRKLVLEADPGMTEDWKWGTAVWAHNGNVVAIGAFKDHLKLNFFKGAELEDPHGLFNAGLDAKGSRAIDLHEGDDIDGRALQNLVRAAVAANTGSKKK